ncbi:MAG: hypothetical protein KF745_08315 [Phycisphaeraceae bacterium]|nr:hypothetical protein [Phycisphaeraceae bacterium]
MPPLPRLRIPALADLAKQLRFQPAKSALRQLESTERLAAEIDPNRAYPQDWVVFRITGYRADSGAEDEHAGNLIVGQALLADLTALAERLSVTAQIGPAQHPEGAWLDAAALGARWGVSRKTIDRYRRRGLLARRLIGDDSRHRLVFAREAVEAFERAHAAALAEARGFSRVDASVEARIVRRAGVYRRRLGCSLNQAARRLAARFGRSQEGVRQVLRRHDAALVGRGGAPIFDDPAPLRPGDRAAIARELDAGRPAREVALGHRKKPADVQHAGVLARAERLRGLGLAEPPSPPAAGKKAAALLASPEVMLGLGSPGPATLAELLAYCASAPPPDARAESARGAAYWVLHDRARSEIEMLDRHRPSAAAVDEIETSLRWAARLRAELVRSLLPLALRSIVGRLEREVTALPGPAARDVVVTSISVLVESLDRFDPHKGGRAAAPAGLALNRALSAWARGAGATWLAAPKAGAGRASPRADPGAVALEDFTRRVCPWQEVLEPDSRVRGALARLEAKHRDILVSRHGWGGRPPATLRDLAQARRVTPSQIVRLERSAVRAALAMAAGGSR